MADEEVKEEKDPQETEEVKEEKKPSNKRNAQKDLEGDKKSKDKSNLSENPDTVDLPTQRKRDRKATKLREDWANEVVANKKVIREERRRKLKKAMLFILTFSIIITSIVYVMLLFIQENNVRITAKSDSDEKTISLSMDNDFWTPYLNSKGPDTVSDISYSKEYEREEIRTISEVKSLLSADTIEVGDMHGNNHICFTFMLRNSGSLTATIDYHMTVESDGKGLENAVRVMWGESYKSKIGTVDEETGVAYEPTVEVFATLSNDDRLAGTSINFDRSKEDGYIEYMAYPLGSTAFDTILEYEQELATDDKDKSALDKQQDAVDKGFIATTPFASSEYVFEKTTELAAGDIMYVYVCIWLEGSDYQCIDDVLASSVILGVDFMAY